MLSSRMLSRKAALAALIIKVAGEFKAPSISLCAGRRAQENVVGPNLSEDGRALLLHAVEPHAAAQAADTEPNADESAESGERERKWLRWLDDSDDEPLGWGEGSDADSWDSDCDANDYPQARELMERVPIRRCDAGDVGDEDPDSEDFLPPFTITVHQMAGDTLTFQFPHVAENGMRSFLPALSARLLKMAMLAPLFQNEAGFDVNSKAWIVESEKRIHLFRAGAEEELEIRAEVVDDKQNSERDGERNVVLYAVVDEPPPEEQDLRRRCEMRGPKMHTLDMRVKANRIYAKDCDFGEFRLKDGSIETVEERQRRGVFMPKHGLRGAGPMGFRRAECTCPPNQGCVCGGGRAAESTDSDYKSD